MEEHNFEKTISKIAGFLVLFSLLVFLSLMMFLPKAPDFIAFFLIFLFIGGIVLFLVRKFIKGFVLKTTRNRKLLIILLVLLLPVFSFYWYELRPNRIRKNCERLVFSEEKAAYRGTAAVRQNNKYRQCLIKNGLKPESLFVNTE